MVVAMKRITNKKVIYVTKKWVCINTLSDLYKSPGKPMTRYNLEFGSARL